MSAKSYLIGLTPAFPLVIKKQKIINVQKKKKIAASVRHVTIFNDTQTQTQTQTQRNRKRVGIRNRNWGES